MLKTILLDLDDTLLDFHTAEAIALKKTLKQLDLEPSEAIITRYSAINAAHWRLLETGKLTRPEVLTGRFRVLFSELGIERSASQAQEIYERLLAIGHYFIPGAPELLEALYPEYDLYLASNGTATVQDSRIASAGIGHYFKSIFISERIGFDKPRLEFFECCFKAIPEFSHSQTIIIGDSLTSDIRGGNNAGIHTCWFNPAKKPNSTNIQAEYEVSDLKQIPVLLKSIGKQRE